MPQQHNVRSANPQLEEQKIKLHFTPVIAERDNSTVRGDNSTVRGDNFAVQLVFLYYILSHQESVHSEPGIFLLLQLFLNFIMCLKLSKRKSIGDVIGLDYGIYRSLTVTLVTLMKV